MKNQSEGKKNEWPNPNEIVKEFFENTTNNDNEIKSIEEPWKLPIELQNMPNLPPSLWPLNSQTINDPILTQWT